MVRLDPTLGAVALALAVSDWLGPSGSCPRSGRCQEPNGASAGARHQLRDRTPRTAAAGRPGRRRRSRSMARSTSPPGTTPPSRSHFIQNDPRRASRRPSTPRSGCSTTTTRCISACSPKTTTRRASSSTTSRRTTTPTSSDGFRIILDTFHDERNGYQFATNPAGAKWDAQMSNEGRENNANWDGIWDVATTRDRNRLVRRDPDSVPHAEVRRAPTCRRGASTSSARCAG